MRNPIAILSAIAFMAATPACVDGHLDSRVAPTVGVVDAAICAMVPVLSGNAVAGTACQDVAGIVQAVLADMSKFPEVKPGAAVKPATYKAVLIDGDVNPVAFIHADLWAQAATVDLDCAQWEPRGVDGEVYARECSDPVEGSHYTIGLGDGEPVRVANFCTPQWFSDAPRGSRYDYLGLCREPWQILGPYGYAVVKRAGVVSTLPTGLTLAARKAHPMARTARRLGSPRRDQG